MTEPVINCPICERPVVWRQDNVFRPFCSKRCQLIDLGEWAGGGRLIESDPDYDDLTAEDLDKNL